MAIKIKRADASTDDLDKDTEIQTLKALEKYYIEGSQEKPRSFIRLFDCFRHEGPNGIHNCLVMELLGPSIADINQVNNMVDGFLAPDTILRTSREVLEGVEFAHQAGFVHGGIRILFLVSILLGLSHALEFKTMSVLTYGTNRYISY